MVLNEAHIATSVSAVSTELRAKQLRFDPRKGRTVDRSWKVADSFNPDADVVLHSGDSLSFLKTLPDASIAMAISSPPYNLGKEYEVPVRLEHYLAEQTSVLEQLTRVVADTGSVCWQVGNYVERGEVFPLDIYFYPIFKRLGLRLRNRIVWHFGHGLHASRRFSGRYETLMWFTKGDRYKFNLDLVRVPSMYPGKRYYKGPKKGQVSGNPLGKNPSDFWEGLAEEWDDATWNIPNVKFNHPEKTNHPCQFPVELVERCVL
ncbi:DNA methylase N-4/N-6 domain-containing protein, partial [mine drainage metagenome]